MEIGKLISTMVGKIWGLPLMFILIGTGLFLTFFIKFIQFRGFSHAVKVIMGKFDNKDDPGEISHFQALSTALSATIGTGNIVGVAAAILIGGPGAVFWMWVTALVGMATKFASCTLAVKYRKIDENGEAHGGPMHFIEMGMGPRFKWLAILFALFTVLASFGIGNMFQINNVSINFIKLLNLSSDPASAPFIIKLIIGLSIAALVGLVIIGGIRSIGRFASRIVPFMCLFYFVGGLIIIFKHMHGIPQAFNMIFYNAFHVPEALTGGLFGTVIRAGVARGLFSNEAGLGSAAMAHAAAKTKEPVREGLVAMLGPFIDTIVICTITALTIILTDAYNIESTKGLVTSVAFERGLGSYLGGKFISLSIILFAFTTLISWSYYGDRAADYLFNKKAIIPYRIIYIVFIVIGACIKLDVVIDFSDLMNGLMAFPNLIALVVLSPVVFKLTKEYFSKIKKF